MQAGNGVDDDEDGEIRLVGISRSSGDNILSIDTLGNISGAPKIIEFQDADATISFEEKRDEEEGRKLTIKAGSVGDITNGAHDGGDLELKGGDGNGTGSSAGNVIITGNNLSATASESGSNLTIDSGTGWSELKLNATSTDASDHHNYISSVNQKLKFLAGPYDDDCVLTIEKTPKGTITLGEGTDTGIGTPTLRTKQANQGLILDAAGPITLKSNEARAINFHMRNTNVEFGDADSTTPNPANASTAPSYNWNSIASSSDGTKLAATVLGGNIFTSTNSGANWTSRASSKNWYGITSSADGTKLAAVVYNGNIWTSSNSGVNWTSRASTKNWWDITSSADGMKLAAVVKGGNIWTSSNSGATWTEDTSVGATKNWYGITSSADGTKLAAVVSGGNIWTSNNSGATWTEDTSVNATKTWNDITSSADGKYLAATWGTGTGTAGAGSIYTSSDYGNTWSESTSSANGTNGRQWRQITSSACGTLLAATVAHSNSGIYLSNDVGNTWEKSAFGLPERQWSPIASSADGTMIYAGVYTGYISRIHRGNLMGIDSPSPIGTLTIGDGHSQSVPSLGNMIVIGRTNGAGARRWLGMTVDSDYMLSFGDCGIGTSTKSSLDKKAFRIQFRAPDNTLVVGGGTNGDKVGVGIGESSPGTKLVISHTFPTVPTNASSPVSVAHAIESGITFKSDLNSAAGGVWTRAMQKVARIYWQPLYFNDVGSGYGGNHGNLCFTSNAFNSPDTAYPAMVINTVGNVGIGTTSPSYPLEVSGSATAASIGTYAQFYMGTGIGPPFAATGTSSTSPDVSIYAEKSIWTGKRLLSTSDERIKENITEVPDNLALQMLRDIDCNYYEYKDKISSGTQQTIGFIAQQVKEHLSIAVSIKKSIIPNEMRVLEATWDGLNMSSDLTDVSGVKYKFYVSNDPSGNDEVKKEIVGNEDNTFTFDKHYNNVFCYGKEVDDFHTLDKQKLFALNFSATQEIDKIQQEEKTKLAAAEERITALETENASLKAQLNSIEARLAALEA